MVDMNDLATFCVDTEQIDGFAKLLALKNNALKDLEATFNDDTSSVRYVDIPSHYPEHLLLRSTTLKSRSA
jgi:hypothetical protein